jgi:hypothetical protein
MLSFIISSEEDNYPWNDKMEYNTNERLFVPTKG